MKTKRRIAGAISVVILTCMFQFPTVFAARINLNGRDLNLDIKADHTVDDADLTEVRNGLVGKNTSDIDVNCDGEKKVKDLIAMKVFLEKNYGKDNDFSVNDL